MAFPKEQPAIPPTAVPPRERPRKPFGALEQKMVAPERPGYRRYWFNDEPGRIQRALEAGYDHVKEDGAPIDRIVGRGERGSGLKAYLMEIPEEWYLQDMATQQADRDARMRQIKEGKLGSEPGDNRYVPQQGISIGPSERR